MSKNLCAKTRPVSDPYEVWQSLDGDTTWKVLRKYQSPEKEDENEYARWLCAVTSPWATNEIGDVYVRSIYGYAVRVK